MLLLWCGSLPRIGTDSPVWSSWEMRKLECLENPWWSISSMPFPPERPYITSSTHLVFLQLSKALEVEVFKTISWAIFFLETKKCYTCNWQREREGEVECMLSPACGLSFDFFVEGFNFFCKDYKLLYLSTHVFTSPHIVSISIAHRNTS